MSVLISVALDFGWALGTTCSQLYYSWSNLYGLCFFCRESSSWSSSSLSSHFSLSSSSSYMCLLSCFFSFFFLLSFLFSPPVSFLLSSLSSSSLTSSSFPFFVCFFFFNILMHTKCWYELITCSFFSLLVKSLTTCRIFIYCFFLSLIMRWLYVYYVQSVYSSFVICFCTLFFFNSHEQHTNQCCFFSKADESVCFRLSWVRGDQEWVFVLDFCVA